MTAVVMDQRKTSPDRLAVPSLGSTFRIPKRKCPASGSSVQMESPLSRLPESSSLKVQWGQFSPDRRRPRGLGQLAGTGPSDISQTSNTSRTDRAALMSVLKAVPTQEMRSQAVRVHMSSLQRDPLTRHVGSGPQRGSDSPAPASARRPLPPRPPSSPLRRFRPKRASDTLCQDENLQGAPSSPQGRRSRVGLRGSLQPAREREVEEKMILECGGSSPGESKISSPSAEIKEEERDKRDISGFKMKAEDTGGTRESSNRTVLPGLSAVHQPSQTRSRGLADRRACLEVPAGPEEGSDVASLLPKDPKRVRSASRSPRLLVEKVFPLSWPGKPSVRPPEPIVLSSDEEEAERDGQSQYRVPASRAELAADGGTGPRAEKANAHPAQSRTSASGQRAGGPTESAEGCGEESSLVELQFLTLHAGGAVVEANGNIMVTADCMIITLKDPSGGAAESLALVPSELRGYGTWARQPHVLLLFLWVSVAQARLIQQELSAVRPAGLPEQACPFLLLTLEESSDGLQGALLASLLDVMGQRCGKSGLRPSLSRDRVIALVRNSFWAKTLLPLLESEPSPALDHPDQAELPFWLGGPTRNSPRRAGTTGSQEHGPSRRLIQFPPPPSKGGITVRVEDLECLNSGEFLNDVVIDFYLKYLMLEKAPKGIAERSHIFSSFFYKQLTRRGCTGEEEASVSPKHRRHHRVRNWTRNVDIFNKDFLFLPVNQEAHWYLVVICFPWLETVVYEDWGILSTPGNAGAEKTRRFQATDDGTKGTNSASPDVRRERGGPEAGQHVAQGTPKSLPECTQLGCLRKTVCKRPCILLMDSLKLSRHEQIFKLLREYLEVEWEARRGTPRGFTAEQVVGSHCRVPLQDNNSDCGLYLLQYAESFLQNPVVHFDLPLRLERWFPRQQVRTKRHLIRELVVQLYRKQGGGT